MVKDLLASPAGEQIKKQSPLGRVARPEDVAHAVLFLASEGAEFATGTIIDVNGASYLRSGYTLESRISISINHFCLIFKP